MGLAEKRAARTFVEKQFPTIKSEIVGAMGFDVPIDVEWETLAMEGLAEHPYLGYERAWPKLFFEPLARAVRSVCADDLGKDALREKLKKIVVQNKAGNFSAGSCSSFEAGVLTIDHACDTNVENVDERAEAIQKTLESAL